MKHVVTLTTSNPAHEHVSLRRKQSTTNFMVEAADEQTAILRATAHFRRLGHRIHEATVFKKKDEQLNEFFASKETSLGSIVQGAKDKFDELPDVVKGAAEAAYSLTPMGMADAAKKDALDLVDALKSGDYADAAKSAGWLAAGIIPVGRIARVGKGVFGAIKRLPIPRTSVPKPTPTPERVPPTQPRPDQFPVPAPVPGRFPVPTPRFPVPQPKPQPRPQPSPVEPVPGKPTPRRVPENRPMPETKPQPRSGPGSPSRGGPRSPIVIGPKVDVDLDTPNFAGDRGETDIRTLGQYRGLAPVYRFHDFSQSGLQEGMGAAKNAIARVLAKRKQATKISAEGEPNKINMEPKLTPTAGSKI
jgi:hypothetical protein